MLAQKLKEATKIQHDQLEKLMYVGEIMDKSLSHAQYKQLLYANYIAHQTFENEIHQLIPTTIANRLNLDGRVKTRALELDLTENGIAKDQLPDVKPTKFSPYQALGAMYVLEGATLGGQVISKKIQTNTNLVNVPSSHYYGVYGQQLMDNWKEFITVLMSVPDENHEEVIKGATKMFTAMADISKAVQSLQV